MVHDMVSVYLEVEAKVNVCCTCLHVCMYIRMYACMYVYIYAYMCLHVLCIVCVTVCTCVYLQYVLSRSEFMYTICILYLHQLCKFSMMQETYIHMYICIYVCI